MNGGVWNVARFKVRTGPVKNEEVECKTVAVATVTEKREIAVRS